MKIPYSKNKEIHFAFSTVNYKALVGLVRQIDSSGNIRIVATNITWDENYTNLSKTLEFRLERDNDLVSLAFDKSIRDEALLNIMETIHNMKPEEVIITLNPCTGFSDYRCKIVIMYYEDVATICVNESLSEKEVKQLGSKCFIT